MKKNLFLKSTILTALFAGFTPAFGDEPFFATGLELTPEKEYNSFANIARARSNVILSSVDLSKYFPKPGDQGQMGSCTSWAVSYATRSYYWAKGLKRQPISASEIASPSYTYNQTAPTPGPNGKMCGGTSIPSAFRVMMTQGVSSMADWPYSDNGCLPTAPTDTQLSAAGKGKIPGYQNISYSSLSVIDAFRENLERGNPLVVAVILNTMEWSRFKGGEVYTAGPDSLTPSGQHGRHAMVVVGYDDNIKAKNGDVGAFKLMNSWGANWGDQGFIWISYETFKQMVKEAYIMTGLEAPINPREEFVPPPPVNSDLQSKLEAILEEFGTSDFKIEKKGDQFVLVGHGCTDEVKLLRKQVSQFGKSVAVLAEETPWPACEVRGMVKAAFGRGNIDVDVINLEADAPQAVRGVQITLAEANINKTPVLRDTDKFKINIATDEDAPFVQVYYLQSDQTTKEMYRGIVKPNAAGQYQLVLGEAPSPIRLAASGPFGTEAILVLAGKEEIIKEKIAFNASESSFMDMLRETLSDLVAQREDVRASVVQLEVQEKLSKSSNWLITENEYKSFGPMEFASSTGKVTQLSANGPKVSVLSPKLDADVTGTIAIKAAFAAAADAKVNKDSVRIKYKMPVGWFDVTERVKAQAQLTANGISAKPMALPKGKHQIRISVSDTKGRESIVEIFVNVS